MPNNIYDNARYRLLTADLDWRTIPLVLSAWSGAPVFDPTDETIAEVAAHGSAELGSSLLITVQTVALNGTAQTEAIVIPGVPVGPSVTWFTLSQKHPTHTLSQPILFIDEAEGLPYDPNGLDMVVQPDWLENRGWWRP